jgi:glucosamine--fructose-6-phosphate aminotransferase (isomerizing)
MDLIGATNPYIQDILAQPSAVENTLNALENQRLDPSLRGCAREQRFRRIVLTGMGSSCHAFHPSLISLQAAGTPVSLVETSELVHHQKRLLDAGSLVIALSQSGRSAEIVRLIESIQGGAHLLGITNDPESPLARAAHATVVMRAGAEHSVATRTYVSSLAALAWVTDELSGGDISSDLRRAPALLAQYLKPWQAHVEQATQELDEIDHLFLAGRGASLASAYTGGLILKEAAHFHGEGMSSAAFRHGPLEMVDTRAFALVFEGDAATAGLNRRLVSDVKEAGGHAALVHEGPDADLFSIPESAAVVRPMLEILPVEMMTLALAAMRGHKAGSFRHVSKVTSTE